MRSKEGNERSDDKACTVFERVREWRNAELKDKKTTYFTILLYPRTPCLDTVEEAVEASSGVKQRKLRLQFLITDVNNCCEAAISAYPAYERGCEVNLCKYSCMQKRW